MKTYCIRMIVGGTVMGVKLKERAMKPAQSIIAALLKKILFGVYLILLVGIIAYTLLFLIMLFI